jgi:hypothetical protein
VGAPAHRAAAAGEGTTLHARACRDWMIS